MVKTKAGRKKSIAPPGVMVALETKETSNLHTKKENPASKGVDPAGSASLASLINKGLITPSKTGVENPIATAVEGLANPVDQEMSEPDTTKGPVTPVKRGISSQVDNKGQVTPDKKTGPSKPSPEKNTNRERACRSYKPRALESGEGPGSGRSSQSPHLGRH